MIADDNDARKHDANGNIDVDKELEASFNAWKSKTYALTVPLKVVALRGSIPPSWIKVCDTRCLNCFAWSFKKKNLIVDCNFCCLSLTCWEQLFCFLLILEVPLIL